MPKHNQELLKAWAPQLDIEPSDGCALLTFETNQGPIALLLPADALLLLRDRIERQLSRKGAGARRD